MTHGKTFIPGFLQNLDTGAALRRLAVNHRCGNRNTKWAFLMEAGFARIGNCTPAGTPALPGRLPCQRHAGFSLLELIIVLAILAILITFAIFGIGGARANLLADRAMYQVMTSLREARMLAMRNNYKVSIDFDSGSGEISVYQLIPDPLFPGSVDACGWNGSPTWEAVGDDQTDPSLRLENGVFFTGSHWNAGDHPFGAPFQDITGGSFPNIFDSSTTGTIANLLFTADGLFTEYDDHCSPKDKVIFIDSPGADPGSTLNRAVTILGVTGRIDGWRLRNNGKWENVK